MKTSGRRQNRSSRANTKLGGIDNGSLAEGAQSLERRLDVFPCRETELIHSADASFLPSVGVLCVVAAALNSKCFPHDGPAQPRTI